MSTKIPDIESISSKPKEEKGNREFNLTKNSSKQRRKRWGAGVETCSKP